MHTKDRLAQALEEADLPEMAAKARTGYYHDFLSPLDFPCLQLEQDLRTVGTEKALAVRRRHLEGEFDADLDESEDWANSPEGIATFERLFGEHHGSKN